MRGRGRTRSIGRLNNIAEFLRRHAIEVERLEAPVEVQAEQFRLRSIEWATAPYQNHLNATAQVDVAPATMTLPEGTYVVRMAQNAARLISELMEPDTDDSLVAWNFLDHSLPAGRTLANRQQPFIVPIYLVMAPARIRASLVP